MLAEINDIDTRVKRKEDFTVLFYADWCGYCARFKPIFTERAKNLKGNYYTVNISDEENPLWDKYDIKVVPTIMLFRDGRICDRLSGGLQEKELMNFMAKNKLS